MEQPDPLTARLARGDASAFEALYDRYGCALHAYLWGQVGNRQTAEDLLQAVMLRLVRHRTRLGAVVSLRGWLYVVARNEARRWARRRANRSTPRWEFRSLDAIGARDAHELSELEALRDALGCLSRERAEIVTLKLHHDLTFAEIGEVLDLSPNTAASRYRRALADLRRLLETADVER